MADGAYMKDLSGVVLMDRYQLQTELGRGGMGTVYKGHDTVLKRDVAVKLLSNTGLGTEGKARMLREAQSAASLNHPNIVAVYDAGEAEIDGDAVPFVVMELVRGQNLHENPPTDLEQTVDIVRQLCTALEHAHSNDIVHRDLKPENVLITSKGTAKLVDFGLARSITSRLTTEGTIVGTLDYMAPELALGQDFDGRADLYALGVMLYELTTGQLPFTADTPIAIISQHVNAPVVPPRAKDPQIPAGLDKLIIQLMSKAAADRPADAAGVLQSLQDPKLLDEVADEEEELSTLDRIVRGRMVGREAEFEKARDMWYAASKGNSQILLVSGEPGVGKTRLLREIITQSEVMGAQVLGSASYAEGGPPYSPFKQILRQVLPMASENGFDLPESILADLLSLAPEFRVQYSEIQPNPSEDPQADQHRLFESFFVFLAALSQRSPLLVYLDDAHWADSGSLGLFRHLARQLSSQPIMLLATYREIELDEARPLNEVLMDVSREQRTSRIKLNRLTMNQTEELLSSFFQEEITSEFLEGIYRETDGNPFFIEEVCKALVESGKLYFENGRWERPDMSELGIPQSVRVAIQSRVGKLSTETQETLSQAAVLGREFGYDTLVEACEVNEEAVIEALEEADRAQLIDERDDQGQLVFAFSHALIPSTLVEGLRILQRRRLHRRAAAAMMKHDPENYSALGMHLLEAGQTEQGVEYLLLAGDQARGLYAHREAISSYLQALDYAKESGNFQLAARTLMKLGIAYHNAFEFEQSRKAYEQGFVYWQRSDAGRPQKELPTAPHPLRVLINRPPTLDPGFVDDVTSGSYADQVFSGLIEFAPDLSVVPNVARSWEVLDQGRRYRFHLRDDVQWSDGQPVTAGDFEFAWKRALDPSLASPASKYLLDIRGAEDYSRGGGQADAVGVRADDDHTLTVELERPTGFFLQLLQVGATFPVPKHVVEAHGLAWTEPDKIVTNGPFCIKAWREDGMTLERYKDFHGLIEGNVTEVEAKFSEEQGNFYQLYQEDQIDILLLHTLPLEDQDRSRQTHADDYITAPILGTFYLGFDVSRPPFDDVRVRKAFAQSIDREPLAEIAIRGQFAPADGGMVPPGIPGYLPDLAPPLDPEGSQRLLQEAGYHDASQFPEVECWVADLPVQTNSIKFIQAQILQHLGLDIKSRSFEFDDYLNHLAVELPHLWIMGWSADYPDPDSFLRLAIQYRAGEFWKHDVYWDLVDRARRTVDQSERMQLYRDAQVVLVEEVPLLPLAYTRGHILLKPWIAKFPLSPLRWDYYKDVIIEPHD